MKEMMKGIEEAKEEGDEVDLSKVINRLEGSLNNALVQKPKSYNHKGIKWEDNEGVFGKHKDTEI